MKVALIHFFFFGNRFIKAIRYTRLPLWKRSVLNCIESVLFVCL